MPGHPPLACRPLGVLTKFPKGIIIPQLLFPDLGRRSFWIHLWMASKKAFLGRKEGLKARARPFRPQSIGPGNKPWFMAYGFRVVTNIKVILGANMCSMLSLLQGLLCPLQHYIADVEAHQSWDRPATCAATRPPPEPTSATTFRGWSGPKVVKIMFLSLKI